MTLVSIKTGRRLYKLGYTKGRCEGGLSGSILVGQQLSENETPRCDLTAGEHKRTSATCVVDNSHSLMSSKIGLAILAVT